MKKFTSVLLALSMIFAIFVPVTNAEASSTMASTMYFDISMADYAEWKAENTSKTVADYLTNTAVKPATSSSVFGTVTAVSDSTLGYEVARFSGATAWGGIIPNARPYTSDMTAGDRFLMEFNIKSDDFGGANDFNSRFNQQFLDDGNDTNISIPVMGFLTDSSGKTVLTVDTSRTTYEVETGAWHHVVIEMVPDTTQGTINIFIDDNRAYTYTSSKCILTSFTATWKSNRNRFNIAPNTTVDIDYYRAWKQTASYDPSVDSDKLLVSTDKYTVSDSSISFLSSMTYAEFKESLAETHSGAFAVDVTGNELSDSADMSTAGKVTVRSLSMRYVKEYLSTQDYFDIDFSEYKSGDATAFINEKGNGNALVQTNGGTVTAEFDAEKGYNVAKFSGGADYWHGITTKTRFTSGISAGDRIIIEFSFKPLNTGSTFVQFGAGGSGLGVRLLDLSSETTAGVRGGSFSYEVGKWIHLVFEMQPGSTSGTVITYLDGAKVAECTSDTCTYDYFNSTAWSVGNRISLGNGVNALVDKYRMYLSGVSYNALSEGDTVEFENEVTVTEGKIVCGEAVRTLTDLDNMLKMKNNATVAYIDLTGNELKNKSAGVASVNKVVLRSASGDVIKTYGINYTASSSDPMSSILADHSAKLINTVAMDSDGYIGVPASISVFYDKSKGEVKSGSWGTPVILYVINTATDRVGTKTDTEIVGSMLDRGYVVAVLDYFGSDKTVSPALDWSVQGIRIKLNTGVYFTDESFPKNNYLETFVVPAGYDVSLNNVFWEIDKHGVDGTMEAIVDNWNTDFRYENGNHIVKWVDENGNRKQTQNDFSGNSPEWLNSNGTVDNADGEYIKVKFTKATKIEDCVKIDGSFIDLNLYMHIVYPTSPENEVPVMCLASSHQHLAENAATADRPQFNGFLFNGYAGVIYDYGYMPMTRTDHGYTNYGGGYTGDPVGYSIHWNNNTKIETAAMRFIRYMAASDSSYNFDTESIGVYGNSKGGWMTALGEEHPENLAPIRYYAGHHGETRYENGKTETVGLIDGGEEQPWLSYNGVTLDSGADFVYASCGGADKYITDGHAPTFISANYGDGTFYATSNSFYNLARAHDVPSLYFEVTNGHTFATSSDMKHNIDSYDAFFDFVGYYLKKEPVKVLYTDPVSATTELSTSAKITFKFSGAVPESEIVKTVLKDENENVIKGNWSASYGNTEWTFTPSKHYDGHTVYEFTIPASVKGDNGKEMGSDYVCRFQTEREKPAAKVDDTNEAITTNQSGTYLTMNVPDCSKITAFVANKYMLRFSVANDAANTAMIYAVNAVGDTNGDLLGEVALKGKGNYEIDVTEYVEGYMTGDELIFYIKAKKSPGTSVVYNAPLTSSLNLCGLGAYTSGTFGTAPDGTPSMKAEIGTNVNASGTPQYADMELYSNPSVVLYTNSSALGEITDVDYGRKLNISVDVYDTASRSVQFYLSSLTSRYTGIADYDWPIKNFTTAENSWKTFNIDYTVYDRDYTGGTSSKRQIYLNADSVGNTGKPLYVKNLSITETVTDITVDTVDLICTTEDNIAEKEPVSNRPFAVYNGEDLIGRYDTLSDAFSVYKNGCTVKLLSNYTFTDEDAWYNWATLTDISIDLNGYKLIAGSKEKSLFATKLLANSTENTQITISNGAVLLKDTSLVSYESEAVTNLKKKYDFIFNDVTFVLKKNAGLKSVFNSSLLSDDAGITTDMTFNSCVLDIDGSRVTQATATVFAKSTEGMTFNYKLCGGEMRLSTLKSIKIYERMKDVVFYKTGNVYTALTLPNSDSIGTQYFRIEDSVGSYKSETVGKTHTEYKLQREEGASSYGYIPDKYSSVDDFPFVLFDESGACKAGYAVWADAMHALRSYNEEDGVVILLRRDFEITSSDQYANAVFHSSSKIIPEHTVDLGGHKLTCQSNAFLLHLTAKAGGAYGFDLTFKNGEITATDSSIFAIFTGTTAKSIERTFNVTFDAITFNVAENAEIPSLFFTEKSVTTGYADVTNNITFNSCIFDITGKKPASAMTIFKLGESSGAFKFNIRINGGEFKSKSSSDVTLIEKVSSDAVAVFGKMDGSYMTVTLPNGIDVMQDYFRLDDGFGKFAASSVGETNTVYTLQKDANGTEYGIIPTAFSSVESYPFVIFKADSTFVGGYAYWKDAMTALKGTLSDGSVLLLRRDFSVAETDVYEEIASHSTANSIPFQVIDLDGHKLSSVSGSNLLLIKANSGSEYGFDLTFKNGDICTVNTPLFKFYSESDCVDANRSYKLTFDDVTFGIISANTSSMMFAYDMSASNISQIPTEIAYNDCTFDLATVSPKSNITVFDTEGASDGLDIDINVSGGLLKAEDTSLVRISSANDSLSKVHFTKGKNDSYLTAIFPTDAPMLDGKYRLEYGYGVFTLVSSDSQVTTAVLASDPINTDYGVVSEQYASIKDYPFVIFKADSSFVGGYSTWSDALSALRNIKTEENAVLLLRRDFTLTGSDDYVNLIYHSTQDKIYNHIVDLAGNTFTCDSDKNFMKLQIKGYNGYGINMTVKNGIIELSNKALFGYSASGESLELSRKIDIKLDNVQIGLAKGSTLKSLIFDYSSMPTTLNPVPAKFTFNDCTFDLWSREPSGSMTIFAVGDNANRLKIDVTMLGGEILAKSSASLKLVNETGSVSNVKFAKNDSESYTQLTLSSAAEPISETLNIDDGKGQFTKLSTSNGRSVYVLKQQEETKYGIIPATYSKEAYPFAAFKQDKSFYKAYSTFSDALFDIRWLKEDGVTLLLRRDYTQTDSPYGNITYHSTSSAIPKHTVDLGGNTFNVNTDDNLMRLEIKGIDGYGFDLTFKNGKIVAGKKSLFKVLTATQPTISRQYTLSFEDIDFALSNTTNPTSFVFEYNTIDSNLTELPFNVKFTDCSFDFKTVKPQSAMTLFNIGETKNKLAMNVSISGGSIKLASVSDFTVSTVNGNKSTITLTKNADNRYLTVYAPYGTELEGVSVKTDVGDTVYTAYIRGGKLTVYGPRITDTTVDDAVLAQNGKLLSIENIGSACRLIIGGYDENSRFTDYEIYEVYADVTVDADDVSLDSNPNTTKAFLLDGISGIRPLCPCIPITISGK